MGENYLTAAKRELQEETGIVAREDELILLGKAKTDSFDPVTKKHNNTYRQVYAYRLADGQSIVRDPKETSEFEHVSFDKLRQLDENEKKRFIRWMLSPFMMDVYKRIEQMI